MDLFEKCYGYTEAKEAIKSGPLSLFYSDDQERRL